MSEQTADELVQAKKECNESERRRCEREMKIQPLTVAKRQNDFRREKEEPQNDSVSDNDDNNDNGTSVNGEDELARWRWQRRIADDDDVNDWRAESTLSHREYIQCVFYTAYGKQTS